MSKLPETIALEQAIYHTTNKQGTFGCFEVTIGWFGSERVDYITYDTKGIWRCYEIKVTKSDFYSKAKKTFVGHFNYFVMPTELFEQVKDDIPDYVGVYANGTYSAKKAKRRELGADEEVLKNSLIRSLSRDVEKSLRSDNPNYVDMMNRRVRDLERQRDQYRDKYLNILNIGIDKYGSGWHRETMKEG